MAARRIAADDLPATAEGDARGRSYVAQLDARRRTLADEVEDDVAPVRQLTMQERGEWIASACRSTWDILRTREDARRWRFVSRAPLGHTELYTILRYGDHAGIVPSWTRHAR